MRSAKEWAGMFCAEGFSEEAAEAIQQARLEGARWMVDNWLAYEVGMVDVDDVLEVAP